MPNFEPFLNATDLHQLTLREHTDHSFIFPQSLKAEADTIWQQLLVEQPNLHASPLYRVLTIDDEIIVATADFTYRDIVGIRNADNFVKHFSTIPLALSMIAFVTTYDKQTVLIERNTGDWPTSLELPGAFMRPAYGPNLYEQALRFLHNDLALVETDLEKHSILGVVHNPHICEAMVVVQIVTKRSLAELQQQAPKPVHAIPLNYAIENHGGLFSTPLHEPTRTVMKLVGAKFGKIG